MTVYAWPDLADWKASRFELRVVPNLRVHTGPYTPTVQVIDLLGERWAARIDLPPTENPINIAAREAYFDRLKGAAHQISLWHLKLRAPQGTLRDGGTVGITNTAGQALNVVNTVGGALSLVSGTPVLAFAVAQLANTASLRCAPGKTLRAGDPYGLAGQLVRIMADATADGAGLMAIEFQPRARALWPAFSVGVWDRPTANFMLKSGDGVPTVWNPGFAEGASFELIEVI